MAAIDDLSVKTPQGKLNIRVAALIKNGDKILLESGYNGEFFVLPGGRIKFQERAEDAIVRELKEELGEDVKVLRCMYVHQNFFPWNMEIECHEIGFYFLAEATPSLAAKPSVKSLDGNSTFTWVTVEQLKQMEFYPMCIKQDIDNLPQTLQLVTELYEVTKKDGTVRFVRR